MQSLLSRYAVKNADAILGLQAPEPLARLVGQASLNAEDPSIDHGYLMQYSSDFYRATWMGEHQSHAAYRRFIC